MAAATAPELAASGSMDLQGSVFRTDTIAHYATGPGLTYTHIRLSGPKMVDVHYVSYDKKGDPKGLIAPRVEIGKDQCLTGESVSSMALRKSGENRQYLAGINGDFFITSGFAVNHEFGNEILGYPNMSCVIDGKIAAPDMIDIVSRNSALIMGTDGWWIDATDLTYKLLNNDGSTVVAATAVNYPRRDGELMVYNSYMGPSTRTKAGGREIALKPAEGAEWRVNKSVKFTVDGSWSSDGNMAVPSPDGIVISCGKDYHNEFIDGLKAGDVVKLKIGLSLPAFEGIKPDVRDVIGGDVRILKENVVTTEAIRWINTPGSSYPRSLTGYSKDRDLLVIAAVDGGTAQSAGLSYYESADLMRALGCYDALDLDGGGSTALYLSHKGIANHPRDGQERAVGNALYFAIDAPAAENELASIAFADHAKVLPQYGSYKPVIYGYDRHGRLVDTDVKDFELSVDDGFGRVSADKGYIVAEKTGTYGLTATRGGMSARIAVTVDGDFSAQAAVETMLIDNFRRCTVPLQAQVGTELMPVAPEAFEWESSNPEIVDVDASTGILTGVADGTAEVTARRGGAVVATVAVRVECPRSYTMPLEAEGFDASTWKVTKAGVGADYKLEKFENGFRVSFTITSVRGPRITLAKSVPFYSLPDAIRIVADPKGCRYKALNLAVKAADRSRADNISIDGSRLGSGELIVDLDDVFDTSAISTYPLTLSSIGIEPAEGAGGGKDCTLEVSALELVYESVEASVGNVSTGSYGRVLPLTADYGSRRIVCAVAVSRLEVYTATGVKTGFSLDSEVEMPGVPGVYVVVATFASGEQATAKIAIK